MLDKESNAEIPEEPIIAVNSPDKNSPLTDLRISFEPFLPGNENDEYTYYNMHNNSGKDGQTRDNNLKFAQV